MKFKEKLLEGRPHLVVPVVMLVVGVANGSKGPIMYTEKEIGASVPHWNGRPAVVYHPDMNSNFCAGAPDVFNQQRVGTIFNARFDAKAKALKAEAWLDPRRLAEVDPRVLKAIRAGEIVEVSTGLFSTNEPASGTFNGREYQAVSKDHRPDHLAILPDEIGACSIADGAGLCRNELLQFMECQRALGLPSLMA